ncbi:MAG: Gfo/Idh/MocA family oxidoreductase [Cytophagales bacterium]|nr:Gfo/Idh/MocA family oxidoreductase [Cytophagales bacterium]
MNKKIKFAVIGCGHIGKRHAAMIRGNDEAELVAMADVNTSLKDSINKEFKVPFFKSIDDVFRSNLEIDVTNICTPNNEHVAQSLKALEHGYHVVCEKPMALTKADCEKIIDKALRVSKLVFCVMQNRYSPTSVWLKDIISKDILGKIFMVQISCFWNRDKRYYKKNSWRGVLETDGGTLFTQFSHFIDMMHWLFGDITNIKAKFNNFNHKNIIGFEDSGIVTFDFVNGAVGSINYSTSIWDKNLESSMTIIAEHGSVKVGGQYMDKIEYCHIRNYKMPYEIKNILQGKPELLQSNPGNDYGGYKGNAANHHFIIQNVVDTLTGGTVATTNAIEGLKVVEIIERIYALRRND